MDWLRQHKDAHAGRISGRCPRPSRFSSAEPGASALLAAPEPHPKAKVSHAITHRRLKEEKVLLRVTFIVENCGETLLALNAGLTRVGRVPPSRRMCSLNA